MYSELECGICYSIYNAGLRCPRELHCNHSFCESCLLAVSRTFGGPEETDRVIVCPLCRHTTCFSGEKSMRAELRVDELVLERLLAAGVLGREEEEEEEEGHIQGRKEEPAALPETSAGESDSSAGNRRGTHHCMWWNVWRKVIGKSSGQRRRENCMTNDDLRDIALMSSFMF